MSSNREYFGTDGIRGKAGVHPLTEDFAAQLGAAAAQVLLKTTKQGNQKALLAHDGRESAAFLIAGLKAGLKSKGIDCQNLGLLPTPALAQLCAAQQATSNVIGIMLSASHNPAEDNGIKIIQGNGYKLSDEQELAIEALLKDELTAEKVEHSEKDPTQELYDQTALQQYLEITKQAVPNLDLSGMKIALDCANGASSYSSPQALRELGAELEVFSNDAQNGTINENCGSTHPEVIEELTRQSDADIGISHDGDADRVAFCDEKGSALNGDEVMAIIATHMIESKELSKNTLVATSMSNVGLEQCLQQAGGELLRSDVGDRYVLEMMQKEQLNFGGEQSGHFLFLDHSPSGDGLLSALKLLEVIQETEQPLSKLRQCIQLAPQVLLNVEVPAKPPLDQLPKTSDALNSAQEKLGNSGRLLFRYSGTENKLRLLLEGPEKTVLKKLGEQVLEICLKEINTN